MNQVQSKSGYQAYATPTNTQYKKDIDGFIGTMSILGDNLDTTDPGKQGAIDPNAYFKDGINGTDAKEALTPILGE